MIWTRNSGAPSSPGNCFNNEVNEEPRRLGFARVNVFTRGVDEGDGISVTQAPLFLAFVNFCEKFSCRFALVRHSRIFLQKVQHLRDQDLLVQFGQAVPLPELADELLGLDLVLLSQE